VTPTPEETTTSTSAPPATYDIAGSVLVRGWGNGEAAYGKIAEANGYVLGRTRAVPADDEFGAFAQDYTASQNGLAFLEKGQSGQIPDCSMGFGGGFEGVATGAQVTVTDGTGQLLGTAVLTGGILDGEGCHFDYVFQGLPESDFYQIDVAHRGAVAFTRERLSDTGWLAALSIG
jgi:hypothetical protein